MNYLSRFHRLFILVLLLMFQASSLHAQDTPNCDYCDELCGGDLSCLNSCFFEHCTENGVPIHEHVWVLAALGLGLFCWKQKAYFARQRINILSHAVLKYYFKLRNR